MEPDQIQIAIVALAALAVLPAAVILLRAARERKIPGEGQHDWKIQRVLPCGDVLEVCQRCGDRRLFLVRPGEPIEVSVIPKEKWEKAHEALAEALRRRADRQDHSRP